MTIKTGDTAQQRAPISPTEPTGQKRSKSTHKKNPGRRTKQGG